MFCQKIIKIGTGNICIENVNCAGKFFNNKILFIYVTVTHNSLVIRQKGEISKRVFQNGCVRVRG